MTERERAFNILGDACAHLINRARKDGDTKIIPVPQDWADTFRILWQAQAAVFLGVTFYSWRAKNLADMLESEACGALLRQQNN